MSVQVKVGSFNTRSGTGTQAITGVGFEPVGVLFWGDMVNGSHVRNGAASWRMGLSDGTTHLAYAANSGNLLNAVEAAEFTSTALHCLIAVSPEAGPFFTPLVYGWGKVASFDADGFTINIEANVNNLMDGQIWHYLAVGGVGVSAYVDTFAYAASGTITVTGIPFAPTVLLGWRAQDLGVEPPQSGANTASNFGVAVQCNNEQCAWTSLVLSSQPTSFDKGYQKHGIWTASLTTGGAVAGETTVTDWTADGFTVDYTGGGTLSQFYMALGGCAANLGVFDEPLATGTQSIAIESYVPRGVIVGGFNKPTNASVVNDALFTLGAFDGTTQVSQWFGDLNGQPATYKVHERIDTTHAILCATPTSNDASTVNSVGAVSDLSTGLLELDWTTVDGTAREFFYLVLADDFGTGPCGTAPVPSGVTYPIRRVRVFPLPSEKNLRMFLRRLELLLQAGVGLTTGQGVSPTFTVELSRDGGMTYGTVYVRTPGRLGDYAHRAFINQLGNYRNGTVRIAMSDPVLWAILEAFGDLEPGTNWARN